MRAKLGFVIKIILILFLIFIIVLNIYQVRYNKDAFIDVKNRLSSINRGESYQGVLNFWYLMAQNGDWESASKIEQHLDPADISKYKTIYSPEELKKKSDYLSSKSNKTSDDWVELAKVQSMLGNTSEAKKSLENAYKADPIRDDIQKLYYQFN